MCTRGLIVFRHCPRKLSSSPLPTNRHEVCHIFFLMSRKPEKSSTAWTTGERTNLYSTQKPWSGINLADIYFTFQSFCYTHRLLACLNDDVFTWKTALFFSVHLDLIDVPQVRMADSLAIVSCPPVTSKAWHWHHFNAFYTYSSVSFASPIKLYGKYFFMSAVIAKRTRVPPIIN